MYGTPTVSLHSPGFEPLEETEILLSSPEADKLHHRHRVVSFLGGITVFVTCFLVVSTKSYFFESSSSTSSSRSAGNPALSSSAANSSSTLFSFYRKHYSTLSYFTQDTFMKYSFLDNYIGVIEPSAPMFFYVNDFSSTAETYFEIVVCSVSSPSQPCKSGYLSTAGSTIKTKSITLQCSPFDEFTVVATERYESDDVEVRELTGTAVCMYVRRELRDLSSGDLNATMDAMFAIWNYSETEGAELYGGNFHSSTYCKLATTLMFDFFFSCFLSSIFYYSLSCYLILFYYYFVSCRGASFWCRLARRRSHSRRLRIPPTTFEIDKLIRICDASCGCFRVSALLGLHH